jgi:hypothetical protein
MLIMLTTAFIAHEVAPMVAEKAKETKKKREKEKDLKDRILQRMAEVKG